MSKPKITIRPYDDVKINEHAAKVGGFRNLREIVLETEDNEEFYYLVKKPSRAVMQAVAQYENKKDIDGVQKLMLGCVLEGDKEAYEFDGSLYAKLLEKISELLNDTKGTIKKL
jgi:hypothetical protein